MCNLWWCVQDISKYFSSTASLLLRERKILRKRSSLGFTPLLCSDSEKKLICNYRIVVSSLKKTGLLTFVKLPSTQEKILVSSFPKFLLSDMTAWLIIQTLIIFSWQRVFLWWVSNGSNEAIIRPVEKALNFSKCDLQIVCFRSFSFDGLAEFLTHAKSFAFSRQKR